MGTHLSRYLGPSKVKHGSAGSAPKEKKKQKKHHKENKKKKSILQRHHTVGDIHGTLGQIEKHHPQTLFRHASYGDFRTQLHDDFKSVSKRFQDVLGRTQSMPRENREVVNYKHDFQTQYYCDLKSPLSHGRYATVTAAESFFTAQNVAVKIISKDKLIDKKSGQRCAGENVRVEVIALKHLSDQPHVVKFLEVYEDEAFFYVVMELLKGGNLLERINKCGHMKEEQAGPLLKQMLTVTRICHSHGIAHRDLKLENFVFLSDTEDYPLNVVDFGSAAFFKNGESRPFKGAVGTFNYMAPEVHDSYYGPSADVWSLGIIGFALLCSFLPFSGSSIEELREKIKNEEVSFSQPQWEHVSDSVKDLLRKMLEKNPDVRITLSDALAHPWIRQWEF